MFAVSQFYYLSLTGSEELLFGHHLFVQSFLENNHSFCVQPGVKVTFGSGAVLSDVPC